MTVKLARGAEPNLFVLFVFSVVPFWGRARPVLSRAMASQRAPQP